MKSKKKSISELAKAFKSESMSNSYVSNASSRKGSISGLVMPMSKLSLSEVKKPDHEKKDLSLSRDMFG